MAIAKFKATIFKKYVAMYQISSLYKSLHKPSNITTQTCSTMLEEIDGLLTHFPRPEMMPLSEGYLIEILVNIATAWSRKQ